MNPNTTEVITTDDGVTVDMGYYNVPPVRERYMAEMDEGFIAQLVKTGLSFDEAVTKGLYHKARVHVRHPKGSEWMDEAAEAYANGTKQS